MNASYLIAVILALSLLGVARGTFVVPVVTTGTVTLSAGAAALAALKLGAVGGALVGSAIGRSRGRSRGRRGAAPSSCFPVASANLYYTLAANADTYGCAQRFVCEVSAASNVDRLTEEERLIRNLFANSGDVELSGAKRLFHRAASIGAKGDVLRCAKEFLSCPFDRRTLMRAANRQQTL